MTMLKPGKMNEIAEDQRYAGRTMLEKIRIQKSKVPNWKTLVHDRRRWKELVEKAKTLHREL